eukprot:GDKJ01010649.1.p1 GENE.GDKJ01010649.1~~GDKJ01010649.1.p1  ORF type:complete len:451 (+),score=49.19 GDKJ01010649.1:36-1388(+)
MNFGPDAGAHVDAYLEYRNLVGETDGGRMLSEAEFERLKMKAAKAKQNELHVYFRNSDGLDCRAVGPQSQCFCGHKYRDHDWFDTEGKQVHCRVPGCKCGLFEHVPVMGQQDIKCNVCKHSFLEHNCNTRKCQSSCRLQCKTFIAAYRCACGQNYENHNTVFETKKERLVAGLPVANTGSSLAPSGGITSMLDLVDGVDKEELHSHLSLPPSMRHKLSLQDAGNLAITPGHQSSKVLKNGEGESEGVSLEFLTKRTHRGGGWGSCHSESDFRSQPTNVSTSCQTALPSNPLRSMGVNSRSTPGGASMSFMGAVGRSTLSNKATTPPEQIYRNANVTSGLERGLRGNPNASSSGSLRTPSASGFSSTFANRPKAVGTLPASKRHPSLSGNALSTPNESSISEQTYNYPNLSPYERVTPIPKSEEVNERPQSNCGMKSLRAKAQSYRLGGPR